ncbi:MAG: hypothetical protein CMP61_10615 [Flavobacteriales bacterium]|nr:hypothetical protein [Flavobacteriales bacterium]|tara:strand:- start:204 stop:896 length:693 start_codon:yes stop_codon:yes gene_type:complete
MRNVLVFVFLWCIQSSVAQDYVVEERFDPLEYGYDSINLNFRAIAGWGITTNTPFQDEFHQWGSNFFDFRYQYNFKLYKACRFALGAGYNFESYKLKSDSSTLYIDSVFHEKRKLRFQNITTNVGILFQFNEQNDFPTFFQFGAYYDLGVRSSYVTWDEIDDMKFKSRVVNLPFIQNMNYGLECRVGYGQLAAYIRYRYSNRIISNPNDQSLPRITIGIQMDVPISETEY